MASSENPASWGNRPAQAARPVGTIGGVGQSFTVWARNWACPQCKGQNLPKRQRCHRCKAKKPEGAGAYVMDEAFKAALEGGSCDWREAIDPKTSHLYYHNTKTGETSWERPAEMGAAPHATGWFGRGSTHKFARPANFYEERNARWLSRPAVKQKSHIETGKSVLEGANEYNIWYDKYLGDHWTNQKGKEPAEARCETELHAGYTRADKADVQSKYFCIHFARGMCAKGKDCGWFHRTPMPTDDVITDTLKDCFGRERHKDHRDDMGGVGSINKPSRTLYVGGLLKSKYKSAEELERVLWEQFGEWGEVENINVIHRLSICFVRYRLRSSTEFAREAMGNQALEAGEVLNLRWAYDDPNPVAQEALERADVDATVAMLRARGVQVDPSSTDHIEAPSEYKMPEAKRPRLEGGEQVPDDMLYPNTDGQYAGAGGALPQGWIQATDPNSKLPYYVNTATKETRWEPPVLAATAPDDSSSGSVAQAAAAPAAAPAAASASSSDWVETKDPATGAPYYYNAKDGSTSWSKPSEQGPAGGAYAVGQGGAYAYNAYGYGAEDNKEGDAKDESKSEK